MSPANDDWSNFSLSELFRLEAETQATDLAEGLLALEREPGATHWLEAVMRAAHSLKGAAQIVERNDAVRLTHVMEDTFVAAQKGELTLSPARIDVMLQGVDLLSRIAQVDEGDIKDWDAAHRGEVDAFLANLTRSLAEGALPGVPLVAPPPFSAHVPSTIPSGPAIATEDSATPELTAPIPLPIASEMPVIAGLTEETHVLAVVPSLPPVASLPPTAEPKTAEASNRAIRISSDNLNRLMGLAGELVVTSHWAETFSAELLRLKKGQQEVMKLLNLWRGGR